MQIDMQACPADGTRPYPDFLFIKAITAAIFHVIAKRCIARRVMHMERVINNQALMKGITIRIFQR